MSHIFGIPHNVSDALDALNPFYTPTTQTFAPATTATPTVYETVVNADGTTTTKEKCKTRRRKRRLATMSDIKDLAALKAILGGGKAFDTWIATRGR